MCGLGVLDVHIVEDVAVTAGVGEAMVVGVVFFEVVIVSEKQFNAVAELLAFHRFTDIQFAEQIHHELVVDDFVTAFHNLYDDFVGVGFQPVCEYGGDALSGGGGEVVPVFHSCFSFRCWGCVRWGVVGNCHKYTTGGIRLSSTFLKFLEKIFSGRQKCKVYIQKYAAKMKVDSP